MARMSGGVVAQLAARVGEGGLNWADVALADFLVRRTGRNAGADVGANVGAEGDVGDPPELPVAAALASQAASGGALGVRLAEVADWAGTQLGMMWSAASVATALASSPACGRAPVLLRVLGGGGEADDAGAADVPPDEAQAGAGGGLAGTTGDPPLMLAGDRLMLARHWHHAARVEQALLARADAAPSWAAWLDTHTVTALLDALFADNRARGLTVDAQRRASALALRRRLALISGGPGTGKTTSVVRLLAALQALACGADAPFLRIALAAPTGKAAVRLSRAIAERAAAVCLPEALDAGAGALVRAAIPTTVTTLHRLIGLGGGGRAPRFHAGRPLDVDVVVVDEASMVDLALFDALLAAMPDAAALVLLGDRDQLASVGPGGVFGALCRDGTAVRDGGLCDWLRATGNPLPKSSDAGPATVPTSAFAACTAVLDHSYRFADDSGIGRVARLANAGDWPAVWALLAGGDASLALWTPASDRTPMAVLSHWVRERQAAFMAALDAARPPPDSDRAALDAWAATVLAARGRFQVLCALREGRWGTQTINARGAAGATSLAVGSGGVVAEGSAWIFTRNDYGLGLMNGDVGVALRLPSSSALGEGVQVAFPLADGGWRWLRPAQLGNAEPATALTVHKAQGSEYDEVLVVLPDHASPVLDRALLYTAATRARHRLAVLAPINPETYGLA